MLLIRYKFKCSSHHSTFYRSNQTFEIDSLAYASQLSDCSKSKESLQVIEWLPRKQIPINFVRENAMFLPI